MFSNVVRQPNVACIGALMCRGLALLSGDRLGFAPRRSTLPLSVLDRYSRSDEGYKLPLENNSRFKIIRCIKLCN